jgi:hypothetical protein
MTAPYKDKEQPKTASEKSKQTLPGLKVLDIAGF